MKKQTLAASRIAVSVALLCAATFATTAQAHNVVSNDADPSMVTNSVNTMRTELQNTFRAMDELVAVINADDLTDPVAIDDFDVNAARTRFLAAGLIADPTIWDDAAGIIEAKGFVPYIEDLKARMSKFDVLLAETGTKIGAWSELDSDDRIDAVINNTDHNIMVPLAQLQAQMTKLHGFAQVGLLVYAELSYTDNNVGSLIGDVDQVNQAAAAEPAMA